MKRKPKDISPAEARYLNSWLFRYGKRTIFKYQNVPEVILNKYEADLVVNGKEFPANTSEQRLKCILLYIDFLKNVEPRYKRLLKQWGMKGWQMGLLFNYKNGDSWHKSHNRYKYIRAMVTLINKHEEVLYKLNNPGL